MTKTTKINWKRSHRIILDGYVGQILCFHLHLDPVKTKNGPCELICDLPCAAPKHFGRLVSYHDTPKQAARAAEITFKSWIKKLKS